MVYYFYYENPAAPDKSIDVSCSKTIIERDHKGFNKKGFTISQIYKTDWKTFPIK